MKLGNANRRRIGRALPSAFMQELREGGKYRPLVEAVHNDKDLNMEFRGSNERNKEYINIYCKGNNILKLHLDGHFEIDLALTTDLDVPLSLVNEETIGGYLELLPKIKDKVTTYDKKSMEIEYEQLLIRANNREIRNNSEYIIVDRQYVMGKDRCDLVAIKWPRNKRKGEHPKGLLVIIEVKYALNREMAEKGAQQLDRYYGYLKKNMESVCEEMELILYQKLDLELIERTKPQIDKLKKLKLDRAIKSTEIILYLIDYNPNSKLKAKLIEKAKELDFANQIQIAHGGFALWDQSSEPLESIAKSGRGKVQ